MTGKQALQTIKNVSIIYTGRLSDINTRFSYEIETIEKDLEVLEIIKQVQEKWEGGKINDLTALARIMELFENDK